MLVVEIQFSNWTDEGLLRHPSFQGLREDKPADKVIHDEPMSISETEKSQGVRLTHPDKVLYPDAGITKQDLADYYAQVAEWMLPHVVDRPLAIVRCPEGSGKACFFQKHPGEGASSTCAGWISRSQRYPNTTW